MYEFKHLYPLPTLLGTPLGDISPEDTTNLKPSPPSALEMTRMIATCRIVLPKTMLRLSAGRMSFSQAEQAMMFLAGANSIFYGDQLLTTKNPEVDKDKELFRVLGLVGKVSFGCIVVLRRYD